MANKVATVDVKLNLELTSARVEDGELFVTFDVIPSLQPKPLKHGDRVRAIALPYFHPFNRPHAVEYLPDEYEGALGTVETGPDDEGDVEVEFDDLSTQSVSPDCLERVI